MKLIAFGAGRKNGNSEVFIKEAMMAAEAKGIEVEFVRLNEFQINPCNACSMQFCPANDDPTHCIYGKDDAAFLLDKFLDSDGMIVGGPVYSTTASSLFYCFRDRLFGPKVDEVMMERFGTPEWAEGRMKHRPGAIISVGGALSQHWVSMGMPSFYSAFFSSSTTVVDFMNVTGIANPGAAVLNDDWIARAHLLGERLADSMINNDLTWKGGDNEEWNVCPSCHFNSVLLNPAKKDLWCTVCGTHGHISVIDDRMVIDWPEEEQNENHLKPCGLSAHGDEIGHVLRNIYMPHKDEIPQKLAKYKEYTQHDLKSPYKEAQKKALIEEAAAKKETH